jgi:hypothetical protein
MQPDSGRTIESIIVSRKDNPDGTTTKLKETLFSDGTRNTEESGVSCNFNYNQQQQQQQQELKTRNQRRRMDNGNHNNGTEILSVHCIDRPEPVAILKNQKLPQSKAHCLVYFCVCRCIYIFSLILFFGGILTWLLTQDCSIDFIKTIINVHWN